MKTNVAMSGVGETRIQAAFSYDNCAMKRKAMCSCLSKLGSQSLQMACLCPNNPGRRKNLKEFHQRGNLEEGKGSIDACDEKKKEKRKRVFAHDIIGLGLGGRREERERNERGKGLGV